MRERSTRDLNHPQAQAFLVQIDETAGVEWGGGGTIFPRITECMRYQLSKYFLGVGIGDWHPERANTWPLLTVLPSGAGCEFPVSLPLSRFSCI